MIATENNPLSLAVESFPKVIVKHNMKKCYDEIGALNISTIDFLLDKELVSICKREPIHMTFMSFR